MTNAGLEYHNQFTLWINIKERPLIRSDETNTKRYNIIAICAIFIPPHVENNSVSKISHDRFFNLITIEQCVLIHIVIYLYRYSDENMTMYVLMAIEIIWFIAIFL